MEEDINKELVLSKLDYCISLVRKLNIWETERKNLINELVNIEKNVRDYL